MKNLTIYKTNLYGFKLVNTYREIYCGNRFFYTAESIDQLIKNKEFHGEFSIRNNQELMSNIYVTSDRNRNFVRELITGEKIPIYKQNLSFGNSLLFWNYPYANLASFRDLKKYDSGYILKYDINECSMIIEENMDQVKKYQMEHLDIDNFRKEIEQLKKLNQEMVEAIFRFYQAKEGISESNQEVTKNIVKLLERKARQ